MFSLKMNGLNSSLNTWQSILVKIMLWLVWNGLNRVTYLDRWKPLLEI